MRVEVWRHNSVDLENEAVLLTHDNAKAVADWCNGQEREEIDPDDASKRYAGVNVPTPEGRVRASEGDYITKDLSGHFTVRKPNRFKSLWHKVI